MYFSQVAGLGLNRGVRLARNVRVRARCQFQRIPFIPLAEKAQLGILWAAICWKIDLEANGAKRKDDVPNRGRYGIARGQTADF